MTILNDFTVVLTPGQAVQQAGATAETYLARAMSCVSPPGKSSPPPPDIIAAVIQAQALDYLAWVVGEGLTNIADQLREGAGVQIAEAVGGVAEELANESLREPARALDRIACALERGL